MFPVLIKNKKREPKSLKYIHIFRRIWRKNGWRANIHEQVLSNNWFYDSMSLIKLHTSKFILIAFTFAHLNNPNIK